MVDQASGGASRPPIDEVRADVTRLHIRTWRAKAEEVRTIADGMRNDHARRGMLNAAANYELLADEAEERDKPEDARSRPKAG